VHYLDITEINLKQIKWKHIYWFNVSGRRLSVVSTVTDP